MTTARDLVTSRIAAQARRFPDLDIAPMDVSELEPRDAALALAIEHAVLRHWLTLETVIETRLSRPWHELEAKLQAALLVGAAQLLILDKLPDHAVINETVEWTKRRVRAKAAGLVNAVLRKVAGLRMELTMRDSDAPLGRDELPLSDGRIWRLSEPVFDDHPVRRLAQQTSHPEPLIAHWQATFGQAQTTTLALHSLVHAPIIVHGIDDATAKQHDLLPHDQAGFFIFTGDRAALMRFLQQAPGAIVQDPTSAAPVQATANLSPPPRLIIDACAGRGTKTKQLAAVHSGARIIASDINPQRVQVLREQFQEHPRVEVVEYPWLRQFDEQADLLVLDVPCSNTGVLARRVEAKYRFSAPMVAQVAALQRQAIADAIPLLSPTGRLLYATCSIEAAENQQQTQWMSKWHRMTVISSRTRLPAGVPGDPPRTYSDGGFFALLQRSGQ